MSDTVSSSVSSERLLEMLHKTNRENAALRARVKTYENEMETIRSHYEQEITSLRNELAENAQLFEEALAEADQEKADLTTQLETVTAERDDFRQQAETLPEDIEATIAELSGKIRTRDHQDAWTKAIGKDLEDGFDIGALWKLLGYTPDNDEIDDKAISGHLKKAREAYPKMFKPPAPEAGAESPGGTNGSTPQRREPLTQGLEGGRGAAAPAGKFLVRQSQLKDPDFMAQNQSAIAEASRSGLFQIVEG